MKNESRGFPASILRSAICILHLPVQIVQIVRGESAIFARILQMSASSLDNLGQFGLLTYSSHTFFSKKTSILNGESDQIVRAKKIGQFGQLLRTSSLLSRVMKEARMESAVAEALIRRLSLLALSFLMREHEAYFWRVGERIRLLQEHRTFPNEKRGFAREFTSEMRVAKRCLEKCAGKSAIFPRVFDDDP